MDNISIAFTWDAEKAAQNLAKHGVPFEAIARFDWVNAKTDPDGRFEYGEHRWRAYGSIDGRVHACVFTDRDDTRRIISLRKANAREIAKYRIYLDAQADL